MKFAIVLKTTAGAAALVTGLAGQPATAADIAQPPMFEQGRQDRNAWEQWFNSLAGDYKTGAFYWAGQRSLPHPGSCQQMDAGFYRGCTDAKVKLATSDELRKTEPAYKAGWNSYTPTVAAISAPEMASAPTPTAAPGSNQTAVEIAKAVAAQLAATKEQQQTPQVTVNLAAPQVSTMAPSPSPPPAYNPAATQPIVVPLPEQPSAPTVASQPLVATVTDAASETAFIDAVERGRRDYNNAGNEMAQGAGACIAPKRSAAPSATVPTSITGPALSIS